MATQNSELRKKENQYVPWGDDEDEEKEQKELGEFVGEENA